MTHQDQNVQYRRMEPGEETPVCDLALRVFDEFIAHLYPARGAREFAEYVRPSALLARLQGRTFVLVAVVSSEIVGMIEIRGYEHICLLFVDGRFQGRGIAAELHRRALAICRRRRPDLAEVTVNSSPNSVAVYKSMGFRVEGSEKTVNGIRFTPMALALGDFPGENSLPG